MATFTSFTRKYHFCCYSHWLAEELHDVDELEQALSVPQPREVLNRLCVKAIDHYEGYADETFVMETYNHPSEAEKPWNSSMIKAQLWGGGSRAAVFIRLLFSFHGFEIRRRSQAEADRRDCALPAIAALDQHQIELIDDLNHRTIAMEQEISAKIAELEKKNAETTEALLGKHSCWVSERTMEMGQVLNTHSNSIADLVAQREQLSFNSLVALVFDILKPLQAVEFMSAVRKVHIIVGEWGRKRGIYME